MACAVALAACGQAHPLAEAAQAESCTRCHGGGADSSGAPPRDLLARTETALASVGAHATHVRALSGNAACKHCHPDPRAGSTAHLDGRVDVVFGAFAAGGGAFASRFDPDTLSCSAVYCHGAFVGGNAGNAPVWTSVGEGQAGCGTCHALPPTATHAGVLADPTACIGCHASTVDAGGNVLAGGDHANGRVDGRHDAPWLEPASVRFHGAFARRGLATCQACHGLNLDGGAAGVACAECHGSGPLSCTSCHPRVPGSGGVRSSHFAGVASPSSSCQTCHDASQLASGHYRLPVEDPTFPDAGCKSCHAGQGQTLGGQTPPLLVGWTDAVQGDYHGARSGTGYGGTLKAPYVRGQPGLPCTACHDQHSSGNAFLFASIVNGTAIPAGAIDRAGVGGEALCSACHEGERHATCMQCHRAGYIYEDGLRYFDPASPPVDPAPPGTPCFWCHGHEGIRFWTPPGTTMTGNVGCAHCHAFSRPATEYAAPTFPEAPTASGVTATTATVRWRTNEGATSYVAYGVGTAGYVSGSDVVVTQHAVTLTGLEPGTSYAWRVRSSDQFRNVTETPLQTFTTTAAGAVPAVDPATVSVVTAYIPSTTTGATVRWYPVTVPSGTALEYEVQLASDSAFTTLSHDTLGRADASLATGNSGWITGTPTQDESVPPRPAVGFDVTLTDLPQDDCWSVWPREYYFRVRARDAVGNVSDWSVTGTFSAIARDPGCR
jgi:predicted CxxxxCH...CXXCH cytochrome family protein